MYDNLVYPITIFDQQLLCENSESTATFDDFLPNLGESNNKKKTPQSGHTTCRLAEVDAESRYTLVDMLITVISRLHLRFLTIA